MRLTKTQKTTIPVELSTEKRKWYLVDVKGKTLGIISTQIADLIRGKNKPDFTPQLDCGDYIVVINAKEIRLARNKAETKMYYWHTQYPGGLRERTANQLLATKPEKVLYDSVWGMLPRNKLRRSIIKKLRIFPGTEHDHISQNPKQLDL